MTVSELIACPKTIQRKRKPIAKEDSRHFKSEIELICSDPRIRMSMFLRRLKDFSEDFTVGLKLNGPNEIMECDIVLMRFQGPHGGQSKALAIKDLHNSYHIHEYTEEDMIRRRKLASYKGIATFSSYEEAIIQFLKTCNIADPNGIFDEERQKIAQIKFDLEGLLSEGGSSNDNH